MIPWSKVVGFFKRLWFEMVLGFWFSYRFGLIYWDSILFRVVFWLWFVIGVVGIYSWSKWYFGARKYGYGVIIGIGGGFMGSGFSLMFMFPEITDRRATHLLIPWYST